MKKRAALGIAAALFLLPSCAHAPTGSHSPRSTVTTTTPPDGWVSESTWTDGPWPLTVPDGQLKCDRGNILTFSANGTAYALNGVAKRKFPSIDPIWRDDPNLPDSKVNITPLLNAGMRLCK